MARQAVEEVECRVVEVEEGYGELGEVAKVEELGQRHRDGDELLDHLLNHKAAASKAFRTTLRQ